MINNSIPIALGTVTILGVVIDNSYVFFASHLMITLLCIVTMINIIRRCNARERRLTHLLTRRGRRADTDSET